MKISFLGGTETVTGSCYLIETDSIKFLIDCGMYQGEDVEKYNFLDYKFNPNEIDFVVLTHAHLDHSGLIPKLFKLGFKGKVYLTPQTADLTRIILYDSAKLQEINNKHLKDPDTLQLNEALYSSFDVDNTVKNMMSIDFFERIEINDDIFFELLPVGHILGASSVFVSIKNTKLLFSGDIGRVEQSLILSYTDYDLKKYQPNYIIMDSLYGGLLHPEKDKTIEEFYRILKSAADTGGKVIIPSFSVHRAQEVLELIKYGYEKKHIPKMKVYFDSPMALAVKRVYLNNLPLMNKGLSYKGDFFPGRGGERFNFEELENVNKAKKSLRISKSLRTVIIAGSGMAEGGRVVGHLYSNLSNNNTYLVFVGFQAENTMGRMIVDGAREVVIERKKIPVRSKIYYLKGFSGHADTSELKDWLNSYDLSDLRSIFLTHSEPERRVELKDILDKEGKNAIIPKLNSSFEIS